MSTTDLLVVVIALFSLILGLIIFVWQVRSGGKYLMQANRISWLLFALFPAIIIFYFFPGSEAGGALLGFSFGGAAAVFILLFYYGARLSSQDIDVDKVREENRALLAERDDYKTQVYTLTEGATSAEPAPKVLTKTEIFAYKLKNKKNKKIGIVTGDISNVRNVADAWVNTENTNMQMARFYDRSISAIIRYRGAEIDPKGRVTSDLIADDLARLMGNDRYVNPATVLVTTSGNLEKSHKVKKILHVASVHGGEVGRGYHPVQNLRACVANAIERANSEELREVGIKSVLFPLLGTGTARGEVEKIVEMLISQAIATMESFEQSSIDTVYFLAFTDRDLQVCQSVLDELDSVSAA